MVISRTDWRLHGDLLEWLATEFPGLSRAQFEAAYRLLATPNVTDAGPRLRPRELRPDARRRAIRAD
jgi:hypothetical protein